jgi:hypothetical protein
MHAYIFWFMISSLPENRRKPTELPTEIIPSQNLSVYTDGINPSATRSVYTDGIFLSVYTDGVYCLSGNMQRRGDVRRFYRRNYRRIQTEIVVQWRVTCTDGIADGITDGSNPSEKTIICRHSLPLFLLLLLSHLTSPLPNCTSPPKLLPNTHPNSPLFSTRALKFLISCTWSQYPFLVDFIIFL